MTGVCKGLQKKDFHEEKGPIWMSDSVST